MLINVCPVFDEVTEICRDENADAMAYVRSKGETVVDLIDPDALRDKVESALTQNPGATLAHYDHGGEDCIYGDDAKPVVDLSNVQLLSGRDVYNVNCSSAAKLGVEAWRRGCRYYWGYTDVVWFTTDALPEFKEGFNFGLKKRYDGLDWATCLQQTKTRMTELIDELVASGRPLAAMSLKRDRDNLVCWGVETPESKCTWRRLALRIFGAKGWFIRRMLQQLVGF